MGSPHLVRVEDVILNLHFHMAHVPTSGGAGFIGRESGRRRVIVKLGVSPSAGLREFLAVLLHEEKVCQGVRHVYDKRRFGALLWFPLDLCDLRALREWLAVPRNTRFESGNYRGIAEDYFQPVVGLGGGDESPVLVTLKVRECDSVP